MNIFDKGQMWFVKRPGATCVTKIVITDITNRTIEIKDMREYTLSNLPYFVPKERYVLGELNFIERLE